MAQTSQYVIQYKLNGERRFELAQLATGTLEEARAALRAVHGENDALISDLRVSKAL